MVDGSAPVLLDGWVPVTTMLIVGRGAIGTALAAQCELLGWAVRTETELECLDVGAARPAETAVSVVGEVLAARRGRSGGPLATAAGRIGE